MALQRIPTTTAQRTARAWPLFDLVYDTDLDSFWLGDGVTFGAVALGGTGGGGTGSTSVLTDNGNGTFTHQNGLGSNVTFDANTPAAVSTDAGNLLTLGGDGDVFFAGGVSADALNSLSVGTDGLPFFTAPTAGSNLFSADLTLAAARVHDLGTNQFELAGSGSYLRVNPGANTAGISSGTAAVDLAGGDINLATAAGSGILLDGVAGTTGQVITVDGAGDTVWGAGLTVDLSFSVVDQAGQVSGAAPVAPPASPDTGDVHFERYDNESIYWTWSGAAWIASLVLADGTDVSLQNTDQVLTGNRVVDLAGNNLTFSDGLTQLIGNPGLNSFLMQGVDGANGGQVVTSPTGVNLSFFGTGALQVDSDPGTAGQVLSSNGVGAAPTWEDLAGPILGLGGGTPTATDFNAAQPVPAPGYVTAIALWDEATGNYAASTALPRRNHTPFLGATALVDGDQGAVPTPLAGEENLFLRGDGIWAASSGAVVAKAPGDFGPSAFPGLVEATVSAAEHGLGTDVVAQIWDMDETAGFRTAFEADELLINVTTGDITIRVNAALNIQVSVQAAS